MKRRWNLLAGTIAVLLIAALVPVAYIEAGCRAPMAGYAPNLSYRSLVPVAERRPEIQTWLSYPEWHVVHSAQSLGRHLAKAPPSAYPWWQDVKGFWSGYCLVNRVTADMSGAGDAKLKSYAIGLDFSAGMLLRGLYENSFGRLFEWIGGWPGETDLYAARVQQRYAAFLHQTPWYRFPFGQTFTGLWDSSSPAFAGDRAPLPGLSGEQASGGDDDAQHGGGVSSAAVEADLSNEGAGDPSDEPNAAEAGFLRHWERRLALSAQYGVTTGYAKLIDAAAGAMAADNRRTLRFVARASRGQIAATDPRLKVVRSVEDGGGIVVEAPRGAAFTAIVERLAARGIALEEVAGNNDIFVTFLMPRPLDSAEGVLLLSHPLPDRPGWSRVGVTTKVPRLLPLIRAAKSQGGTLDHVYDY